MRFITFKQLEGQNFLSFGDNSVCVDLRPGVNAIIGSNLDKEDSKNGAGKSTITELLYYCLYGNTLREIPKDNIQNSQTKKRCRASLEFDISNNQTKDTYKIIRWLNPTKCSLLKNGEDITRSTLAKTNELIQSIIRTPPTVFQNSVIMSANNALPFLALPKTDKRKFIESVLGLEVFTQMVLKVREDYSTAKRDYEINYSKLEQTQNELVFNKTQLQNYEKLKQERVIKLQEKRDRLERDIQSLRSNIITPVINLTKLDEELSQNEKNTNENLKKIDLVKTKLNQLTADVNSEHKQIERLQSNKDKCPTCSRNYSEDHTEHVTSLISNHVSKIEELAKEQCQFNDVLAKLESNLATLKEQTQTIINQKNDANHLINENKTTQMSINYLENNLKETEHDIVAVNNEQNNNLVVHVSSLETKLENSKQEVDKLNNHLNVLETVKFVISEEGIKSFIVKKILAILNSRLAFYLQKLEANCLCRFNEFFDEEIIDENSQSKSYFNFSGGERKRIDLACLFAFADIRRLQGDVNFSTVFYDELLDSSLDDRGVLLSLKVLRERYNEVNESCYIITHRGPEVTTKAEHTIHVIKRNGISTIMC